MSEKCVQIFERCFDAVHLVKPTVHIYERILVGAICLMQASCTISQDRDFTAPVHITGCIYTVPEIPLAVSNVHFHVTQTSIAIHYDTSVAAKCTIIAAPLHGALGQPFIPAEAWIESDDEHESPHSHAKTGLPIRSSNNAHWGIMIRCTTEVDEEVIKPGSVYYYDVQTIDDEGNGGGYCGLVEYEHEEDWEFPEE